MKSRIGHHLGLVLAACAMLAGPAAADERSDFRAALDQGDWRAATKSLDSRARARHGKPGADPVLDADFGLLLAAQGMGIMAAPYLERAIAATREPAERDHLRFELARAREVIGQVDLAEAGYRALATAQGDSAVRAKAALSLARLRLGAAPDAAIALLQPLAGDAAPAAIRWEAELLLSRAQAIAGRGADAQAALKRAWADATAADFPADAIALTAMDMAVEPALAGDRTGEIGLMAIARGQSRFDGIAQLPVCGPALKPDDYVIVAMQADDKNRQIYSAVRASRPGIAQLFTVPLAAIRQRSDGPAQYITLRCRSTLDSSIRFSGAVIPDLGQWIAQNAYYPFPNPVDPSGGDLIGSLRDLLQSAEADAGPDSPVIVPLIVQLALLQGAQARFNNQEKFAEARALAERAIAILAKAGAPEEILAPTRIQTTIAFALNSNIADVAGPAADQLLQAVLARKETNPEQALATLNAMAGWQLKPAHRLALTDRLIAFLDSRKVAADATIRQAVELRRAGILRELGTVDGLGARLAAHGLPLDLCASAEQTAAIPPAAITLTSDDYPKDLLRRSITGMNTVELSLDADGKVVASRMVASQPVGLFDTISTEKLSAVRLSPARRGGQPMACRGFLQTIRWQLPYEPGFSGSPWDMLPDMDD